MHTIRFSSFFRPVPAICFSAFLTLALFSVSFEGTGIQTAKAQTMKGPASFADLVEGLMPAVVNISSTQKARDPKDIPGLPEFPPGSSFEDFYEEFMKRRGLDGPVIPPSSLGSGFVIDAEEGYIVTNNHVIQNADEVRVTFHDDETIEAEVIGMDEKTDIAILKVDTDKKLTELKFGDSNDLRIGDWILAIGNPFGLGGTVTAGIVSAQRRDINAGPYDNFIQTDASINRGNSGGPMFNVNGEVIGINTAIFSPTGGSVGIGFAIPSSITEPVITQLIKYGRTRRGWLGVRIQEVTEEIAESLGLDDPEGALVASVIENSPAEDAAIKPGDIILEFNGRDVPKIRDLPLIVAETEIGSTVEVVVWRDGKEITRKVEVGELEKAEEEGALESKAKKAGEVEVEGTGMTLAPLDQDYREEFGIADNIDGVLIVDIENTSEAASKRLTPGTIILEINQQQVTTPKNAANIIEEAAAAGRSSVLLLVSQEGDDRFVALRLK